MTNKNKYNNTSSWPQETTATITRVRFNDIITCLLLLVIITIITWWENNKYMTGGKPSLDNLKTPPLYDEYDLTRTALKKSKNQNKNTNTNTNTNTSTNDNRNAANALNCISNLIECKEDKQCSKYCKDIIGYNKATCQNGICKHTQSSETSCQNGGIMATYFSYGRNYTTCMCPDEYLGDYCEIPNEMVRVASDKFVL